MKKNKIQLLLSGVRVVAVKDYAEQVVVRFKARTDLINENGISEILKYFNSKVLGADQPYLEHTIRTIEIYVLKSIGWNVFSLIKEYFEQCYNEGYFFDGDKMVWYEDVEVGKRSVYCRQEDDPIFTETLNEDFSHILCGLGRELFPILQNNRDLLNQLGYQQVEYKNGLYNNWRKNKTFDLLKFYRQIIGESSSIDDLQKLDLTLTPEIIEG